MDILIKKALIHDPSLKHHGQRKDILISKGIIKSIAKNISSSNILLIEGDNLHCSIGWCDIGTHLGEPGYEHRDTTQTLSDSASKGGYTGIAPFPNTIPVIQSAADLKYIKSLFGSKIQDLYPIAAISKDLKGNDLTEIKDLIHHGAFALSDGLQGVQSSGLLLRALQYTSSEKIPIIDHAFDVSLTDGGQMHEGSVSISLGMKGIPSIAESIQVLRNCKLAKYSDATLIAHAISTKKSLQFIQDAKKKQTNIYSTVSYLNLVADHNMVEGFDSNFKVTPPLRLPSDSKDLFTAVKKGRIDAIISNHVPLESEKKFLEFPYATPGAIGLETCFSALNSKYGENNLDVIINALSVGPRRILNIPIPSIKTGAKANLTIFDPDMDWTYEKTASLSDNSPYKGDSFKGKPIAIINGSRFHISK
ncbi:MAG: amidohydrolase family protein [Saprospiraceae bacterium]|nr:amidohydrolase family protein [Saprospiraceae bacterium]